MKIDSSMVLWGQTLAYTAYALAIIAVVGWFAHRITRDGDQPNRPGASTWCRFSWSKTLLIAT